MFATVNCIYLWNSQSGTFRSLSRHFITHENCTKNNYINPLKNKINIILLYNITYLLTP